MTSHVDKTAFVFSISAVHTATKMVLNVVNNKNALQQIKIWFPASTCGFGSFLNSIMFDLWPNYSYVLVLFNESVKKIHSWVESDRLSESFTVISLQLLH